MVFRTVISGCKKAKQEESMKAKAVQTFKYVSKYARERNPNALLEPRRFYCRKLVRFIIGNRARCKALQITETLRLRH